MVAALVNGNDTVGVIDTVDDRRSTNLVVRAINSIARAKS
jgi:hypothetical protein